jgi:hypothetical protein
MGTWTTPNASSYMSIGGITFNIGDAINAGYDPFQQNIPYGVLTALGRMNRARGPFGSGNPLALGTRGEDTYIDNSFAQSSDDNYATCAAKGLEFDPVTQVCVPPKEGSTVLGGAGATLADALEELAGVEIPGLLDIPGLEEAVNSGLGGIAGIFDDISEYTGIGGDWAKDVILGPDGVVVVIRDPNQPSQNTGGGAVQTQSGNTTVSVDTGSAAGNVLLTGGTLGEMGGLGSGEGTDTEFIMRGVCAVQGREYDENTGMCKQKSSSQPPAGGTTSTGGDNEEASTTVTIGGGTQADCTNPDYAAANPLECLVIGPNTGDGTPAGGVGPIQQKMCPDGTLVGIDEDCPSTTALTKTCPDGKVVGIDEDCPSTTTLTKTCNDGSVVGIDEDCPSTTALTKTCNDGSVVGIDEDCPSTTALTKTCPDGKVVGIDEDCPNTTIQTQPDCTDPDYAAANPVECGGDGGLNFCDDPDYAAANPEECGGQLNFCDDPDYAAANPEECGGGLTLCGNEIYAMLNPEICSGEVSSGFNMPSGGISRLSSKKSGVADLGVDYDIGGRSIFAPPQAASGGKIENYDLITYLDDILRGR